MKISRNNFNFVLPILSGLLLAIYPLFDFGSLVWISLIPLLYFIILETTTPQRAFIGGWITGAISIGATLKWLFDTAPFEWLGVKSENDLVFTFFAFLILWLVQTLFLGLFVATFSWVFKKLFIPKLNYLWLVLIVPSIWTIFEYLKVWGFNVLWAGEEVTWGAHWTFSNLAHSIHKNIQLIQIADIGGIYLVGFMILMVNVFLFLIIHNFKNKDHYKKLIIILVIGILTITAWRGYGIYKLKLIEDGPQEKIALFQTNFPSGNDFNTYNRKDIFKTVKNLFLDPKNSEEKPDIVIAPEGFGIVSMFGGNEIMKYVLGDFWKPGQIFLENQKIVDDNQKTKSRLFYYDLDREEPIAFSDKMFLMPNGDYLPYITKLLTNIYSFKSDLSQKFFSRGDYPYVAKTSNGNLGGSICTGFMSPSINRKMVNDGAQILISVSSDAPFHGSKTLLNQNIAIAQFRAVENNRFFAQATNMGDSFLINPKGEIIFKSSGPGNRISFLDIKLIDGKTLYAKSGDWILIFCAFMLLYCIFKNAIIINSRH